MLRTLSAMAACAAVAASVFISLPSFVSASAPVPAQKTDLVDSVDCELRSWPYYARGCLRDETRNAGRVARIRLVTTDRIDVAVGFGPEASLEAEPVVHAAVLQAGPEAPSSWQMADREVRVYLAAGDFIRRTVR